MRSGNKTRSGVWMGTHVSVVLRGFERCNDMLWQQAVVFFRTEVAVLQSDSQKHWYRITQSTKTCKEQVG